MDLIPFLPQKLKAVKLLIIFIFDIFSFCGRIVAHLGVDLIPFLPQKVKANFVDFFNEISFVAESWHMAFLKTRSLAKSRSAKFRLEYIKHQFLSAPIGAPFLGRFGKA